MPNVYKVLLNAKELTYKSTICISRFRCMGLAILACGVLALPSQLNAADLAPQIEQMRTAIKDGDLTTARSLLDQGFDPNIKTKDYSGPLFAAIKQKQPDIVSLLISRGADVNAVERPRTKKSALHLAAEQGTEQIVRMLLENGALIDPLNSLEQTPLFSAIAAGVPVNVANTLIEYGTNVNRANTADLTSLEFAATFGFAAKSGRRDFLEPLEAAGATLRIAQVAKSLCDRCHSSNGPGITTFMASSHLAGQHAGYLSKQLIDFRENRRQDNVMNFLVKGMPDSVVIKYSEYFESQIGASTPDKTDTEKYERGELIYNERISSKGLPTCAGCHGVDGKGIQEAEIPNISNFHSYFIETQLKNFRSGKRGNDPNQLMKHVTERLTDDEISDLSLYINEMQ